MKKNDLILIVSVGLYSFLFYHQTFGLNFLLFSVAMTLAFIIKDKSLLKENFWYIAASGAIVSGVCVALYGTALAFAANIVSLSLMSAFSLSRKSSVILASLYSIYAYLSSIAYMVIDSIMRRKQSDKPVDAKFWTKFSIGFGIFVIILVFFILYKNSNPLFQDLTKKINFDFISWEWVRFTLLGFIIVYGFIYARNFPGLYRKDQSLPSGIDKDAVLGKENKFFGKKININLEINSGIILLLLLNVLLFIVNALDVAYLWITQKLPEGMSYSDYVHQGTGTLIISIVLAILIILFYFRGHVNFSEKNKSIKTLAYLWMVQNIIVIASTAYRNILYVNEYSLTYKRIGVYIWLILTLVGIITTIVKIGKHKSNWYLFRQNGWSVYFVLILFACFNWDMVITNYNIKNSKTLDKYYLLNLGSPANIPSLLSLPEDVRDYDVTSDKKYQTERTHGGDYRDYSYSYDFSNAKGNFTATLHKRIYEFLQSNEETDWKSWCYADKKAMDEILRLSKEGKLDRLLLFDNKIEHIGLISRLNNVQYIDFSNNKITDFTGFEKLENLKTLYLTNNSIYNIESFPVMKNLEELDLSRNQITNYLSLAKVKTLKKLNLSGNTGIIDLKSIDSIKSLTYLNLTGDEIKDYSTLIKLNSLKALNISEQKNNDFKTLPAITSLEELNISKNNLGYSNLYLIKTLEQFKNLKKLDLSGNYIKSLYLLTTNYQVLFDFFAKDKNKNEIEPLYKHLEELNVSGNSLENLWALAFYQNLKSLDISYNKFESLYQLNDLKKLEKLNIAHVETENFDDVANLKELKELNVSDNNLTSVSFLKGSKNLLVLKLNNNKLSDISKLSELINLKDLDISDNQVSDISVLKNMKSLEVLDISGNGITDYIALYGLKNLKRLNISDINYETFNLLTDNLPGTMIYVRHFVYDKTYKR
jgi:Leucine-rich repeat (LRR) protein